MQTGVGSRGRWTEYLDALDLAAAPESAALARRFIAEFRWPAAGRSSRTARAVRAVWFELDMP